VSGFCWGGGQTFRYATNNPRLKAAVVCYGPGATAEAMSRISAPVLGVYAENDARITAAVADVDQAMKAAGKTYRYAVYPGTGHGFLRTRTVAAQAGKAWSDIFAFLGETLGK
jgi:carboxymethylenebutenolidase